MKTISNSLSHIRNEIARLESKYGRPRDSVALVAVSKTRPVSDLKEALAAGQKNFGENYLQEAEDKIEALAGENITWHFIGPVQSNKTRVIAAQFDWVHSVDRARIARRLSDARPVNLPPLNICLQVNISGESSKSGVNPEELPTLIEECQSLAGIHVRGLMALPAPNLEFDKQREAFHLVKELLTENNNRLAGMDTLSMGTSHDLEAAIAEGSTMVRVGTAIFGERD